MALLKAGALNGSHADLGVGEGEFKLLCQSAPWTGNQVNVARRTMETMMYGVIELMGLTRINPPAEYTAAVICSFVSGTNVMPACRIMSGGPRAIDAAAGAKSAERNARVTADQLFACCLLIYGRDDGVAVSFEKQTGIAIFDSKGGEESEKPKK